MSTCPSCGTRYGAHERLCPKDGSVLEHDGNPEQDQIGRVFEGKYRLDEFLSRGGMGAVYKATHVMLDRPVAVKVIKPDLVSAPDIARRFQREARAVTQLTHPNIVNIYDFGQTDDGTLYIAMELVSGQSLKEIIRRAGPLDPVRIVKLLGEVVSALSLAHKQNIIHRDLKPHNVMVTRDRDGNEVAKLLDFGIAKTFEGDGTQLTATGSALGTPQYMSPEQATGKTVDARSDIYSLGIILYEMLVGEVPFNDPSTPAVLIAHMSEAPAPPSLKRPDLNLNASLEAIALRCLAKDPADRFQTADELAAELRRVEAGAGEATIPIQARTPPPHAVPTLAVPAEQARTHKVTTPPTATDRTRTAPSPDPVPAAAVTQARAAAPPVGEAPAVVPPPLPVAVPPPPASAARHTQPLEQVAPPPPKGPVVAFLAVAAVVLIVLAGGLYWMMSRSRSADSTNVQQASTATPSLTPAPASPSVPPGTASPSTPSASATPPAATPPSATSPSEPPSKPPAAGNPTPASPASSVPAPTPEATAPAAAGSPNLERPNIAFPGRGRAPALEPAQVPPPSVPPRGNTPATQANPAPAVPSVAFRCTGAPEVCTALRGAMQDAVEREGLTLARAVAGAEVIVTAEADIVDQHSETQFGTTFNIRTYSIEMSVDVPRFDQSVSMAEAKTFTADTRVGRERISENARVVAANTVERIQAYWKKRVP